MKPSRCISLFFLVTVLFLISCKDEDTTPPIDLFSIRINGASLQEGTDNVPTAASLDLVFSVAVAPADFESAFSISPTPRSMTFSYANQDSKVTIDLALEPQTTYQVNIGQAAIGKSGEKLKEPVSRTFTTLKDEIIYSLPPCASASNECLQTISFAANGTGHFDFYTSFPVYEEMAEWQELEAAVIVVHGVNRNANDYFNFLTSTLQALNLDEKVILIAPFFKNDQEASGDHLYWSNTGWREGKNSLGPVAVSSFEVVDQILEQLGDVSHFPVLKKIIVTGHSSGALFTHLYGAANLREADYPNFTFEYIPANSQYYYYPDGQRVNESTQTLYTPAGCTGYDIYPVGFNIVPPYLSATSEEDFNDRFISRSYTYLLGNGSGPDPSLNTSGCYATLLGSTRYQRGENMFRYMELAFGSSHNHKKTIVPNIGHDGQGMYQSPEFRSLLQQLLN